MNIKFNLLFASLCVGLSANALSVTSEAGGLKNVISQNTDATTLVVSGEINALDFEFIADSMKDLTSLDLSQATITAYSGEKLFTGKTSANANTLPSYALAGTKITSIALPTTLTEIGEGALSSTPLTSITIPSSVKTIGMGAFSNCDGLTTIEIPSNVTTLASFAFSGCDNLNTANISNINIINESTFAQCKGLQNVSTSNALSEIKSSAFNGCLALQSFTFGNSLSSIGDNAFRNTGLIAIDMTSCNNLKKIGAWAFAECLSLNTATLNDNTAEIGEGAFFNDNALTSLNIPTACKQLSDYILKGTCLLDSSTITSATVDSIGAYALMGWTQITTITLPPTISYIGDNAFEDWDNLTKISAEAIKSGVPELGDSVWQDLNRPEIKLIVADELEYDFREADQWKDFNITNTTGSGSIEDLIANSQVKIYFIGNELNIEADTEISNVNVYSTTGYQLVSDMPKSLKHAINTEEWTARIYIINVTLSNGSITTVKVARR